MPSEKEIMEDVVRRLSRQPSQSELIQKAIALGTQELIEIESLFQDTLTQVKGFSFGKQSMYQEIDDNIASVLKKTRSLLNHSFTAEQIDRMTYTEKQEARALQTIRMNYMNDVLTRQYEKN